MRALAAAIALLALASCGQQPPSRTTPGPDAAPAASVDWKAALTANPTVLRSYNVADLAAVPGSTLAPADGGVAVTTATAPGSYATMIYLGPLDEFPNASALRVTAEVKTGKLYFITTHENAEADAARFELIVNPGDPQTILLPLDKKGRTILIVANANGEGASTGTLKAVELLAPPAAK